MSDLTRLFEPCQCCSCRADCMPDDFDADSPDEFADCLSEYDLLEGDRPTIDEMEAWYVATRGEPSAAELAVAVAEMRRDVGQFNGFLDVLYDGTPEVVSRWYREDVREF